MKKLVALLLAGTMMFTCAACGGNGGNADNGGNTESTQNTESTGDEGAAKVEITDAAELLTKVWSEYQNAASEEVKFPIGGGDPENMTMDAPGKYDVTVTDAAEGLTATYCVPADVIEKADSFATGVHMMMSNNFATAALHVTDAANTEAVVTAIKEATVNNQWMCGMPEKLIIVTVGEDYVVSAYGLGALIDTYKAAITTVYGDAAVVTVEESLAE